jgi:hypothetical protein
VHDSSISLPKVLVKADIVLNKRLKVLPMLLHVVDHSLTVTQMIGHISFWTNNEEGFQKTFSFLWNKRGKRANIIASYLWRHSAASQLLSLRIKKMFYSHTVVRLRKSNLANKIY